MLEFRTIPSYARYMNKSISPEILTVDNYYEGVTVGNRAILARAITLVESTKIEHQELAQRLLQKLLPETGRAHRIGITGTPGVGKSTTIEALGTKLTNQDHSIAVLAVDPTSSRTGGSILGDKTRMPNLATNTKAYVRPSPTSGTLGGVTKKTRETMALCDAAGFDVILVETVGIGQSESAVANMVDFFVVLIQPGAGDELQGIKKGVLELADLIAVNKSDGELKPKAIATAANYRAALNILTPSLPQWSPPVLNISGLLDEGLGELWNKIIEHRQILKDSELFNSRRNDQAVSWMHDILRDKVERHYQSDPAISEQIEELENNIRSNEITPFLAAQKIAEALNIGGIF